MDTAQLLVVEDEEAWQSLFAEDLERVGIAFTVARSLSEGLACLERRRYDAVLVDLALRGPSVANSDGETIVQVAYELNEGTAVLVVSATATPNTASRMAALLETPTLDKRDGVVNLESIAPLMVEQGASRRPKPTDASLQAVLRGGLDGMTWESRVLSSLPAGSGDISRVRRFLTSLVDPVWPLVLPADRASFSADSETGVLFASYWSRRIGSAVTVLAGGQAVVDKVLESPAAVSRLVGDDTAVDIMNHREKGKLAGAVAVTPGRSRDRFLQSVTSQPRSTAEWLADAISTRSRRS